MSAHHGPPCGHTMLGLCSRCGGPPTSRINAAEQAFAMWQRMGFTPTIQPLMQPSMFVEPIKVEYKAEAAGYMEARLGYYSQTIKGGSYGLASGEALEGSPVCGRCRRPLVRESMVSGNDRCRACGDLEKAANARDAARLAEHQAAPIDPLDVKHGGVTLRYLLKIDEERRREGHPNYRTAWARLSDAQRAAVSAHWSAQLRAKVAASAAADKAREISVVVDLEDW